MAWKNSEDVEIELETADDANIPVNCFVHEPKDTESGKWEWRADNFTPRKETCGGSYDIVGDSREDIMEAVTKYVIPLYEAALSNLRTTGENYYWKPR